MTYNQYEIKRQAKAAIGETKPHAVLVALVLVVIVLILQVLTMSLNGDIAALRNAYEEIMNADYAEMERMLTDMQNGVMPVATGEGAKGFGGVLTFVIELMATVLGVGFSLYALRVSRHVKAGVGDIFDVFGLFFRAVLVSMIPNILVSLWLVVYIFPVSMLIGATSSPIWAFLLLPLVFPALRAYYSYRQAAFILLDNPRANVMGCIALSKAVMDGHRWELFRLDLSFLGWQILQTVAIPAAIWVLPYVRVSQANYYTYVMGDYAARNGQIPHFGNEQPPESEEEPRE